MLLLMEKFCNTQRMCVNKYNLGEGNYSGVIYWELNQYDQCHANQSNAFHLQHQLKRTKTYSLKKGCTSKKAQPPY